MFNKIKSIKDIRQQGKKIQGELEKLTAEGTAAWGKIRVVVDGNQEIKKIEIDDELLSSKSKLIDGIIEATNSALKKVQKDTAMKMKDMGGLDMLKKLDM